MIVCHIMQRRLNRRSKTSGTAPDAPFGLVTLAASGGEGGADIGSMRLAQTGSCKITASRQRASKRNGYSIVLLRAACSTVER